jgi:hypothetical protein
MWQVKIIRNGYIVSVRNLEGRHQLRSLGIDGRIICK